MRVQIENAGLTSAWSESFKGREGDQVEFYRALVTVPGEAPMQLSVAKDDYPLLSEQIGTVGTATVEIDARPGNRVRVYLKEID